MLSKTATHTMALLAIVPGISRCALEVFEVGFAALELLSGVSVSSCPDKISGVRIKLPITVKCSTSVGRTSGGSTLVAATYPSRNEKLTSAKETC